MKEAGIYLQQRRKAAGLSQDEVAARLGMKAFKTVSDWETGKYAPGSDTVAAYIDLVKADPAVFHYLLTGKARNEAHALELLIAERPEMYQRTAEQMSADMEAWQKRDRAGFTEFLLGWFRQVLR